MFGIVKRDQVAGRDDRWLGSRHGVENARTVTLKSTGFPASTDGIVKSGTPVEVGGDGLAVEWAGTNPIAGFVLDDVSIREGDAPVALLWHGLIYTQHLPVATFAVPANPGAFVYVGGNKGIADEDEPEEEE